MWITTEEGDLINLRNVGAILCGSKAVTVVVGEERIEVANNVESGCVVGAIWNEIEGENGWRDNHVLCLDKDIAEGKALFEESEREREEKQRRLYAASTVPETPIEQCGFRSRTLNCLKSKDIKTLRDVAMWTDDELLGIRNFGRESLEEVRGRHSS